MKRFIMAILVLGVSLSLFNYAQSVSKLHPHTHNQFLNYPILKTLGQPWAGRGASYWLASKATAGLQVVATGQYGRQAVQEVDGQLHLDARLDARIGAYVAALFAMSCVAWIVFYPGVTGLIGIMVTLGAILWGYMPVTLGNAATRIYPWDMPAVVAWTWIVVLHSRGYRWWAALLLIPAVMFKETSMLLVILFIDRKRYVELSVACASAAIGSLLAKSLCGWVPGSVELTGWCSGGYTGYRWIYNLRFLFGFEKGWYFSPILANCGTILASVFVCRSKRYATILVLFCGGIMACGVCHEWRIWMEVAPVSAMIFSGWAVRTGKEG